MRNPAIIINANSGKSEKKRKALIELARNHSISYSITKNLDDLERALRTYDAIGSDTLILFGGDGTVDSTIATMRNKKIFAEEPRLILIPGGTTNMTIRDCGINSNTKKALQIILENPNTLKNIKRYPIKISSPELHEPAYGFFFGTGAIPKIIKKTRKNLHSKGMTGPISESLMLLSVLFKLMFGQIEKDKTLRPSPLKVVANNNFDDQAVFAMATTLKKLVLGLNPTPVQNEKIGLITLSTPYRYLWMNLRLLLNGKTSPKKKTGIHRQNDTNFRITPTGSWTLDGEIFDTNNSELELSLEPPVEFLKL